MVILNSLFLLFAFLLLPAQSVFAVDYVKSPPLVQVVKTPVQDCRDSGPTEVKLITWGADEVTTYANGNSKTTQPGSIFADQGLNLKLVREDYFPQQVKDYLSCKSPYLRATAGMANSAVEVASFDQRTEMVAVYQHSWSHGGDTLVVKKGNNAVSDLKGKTGVVQAYGPHVDFLTKVLSSEGLSMKDVNILWVRDITGTDSSPLPAFQQNPKIDFAFMIVPDADAATSGGTVGDGSEDSVAGAKILLDTRTSGTRLIADQYFVRRDYIDSHKSEVRNFVHGLMLADEALRNLVNNKDSRAAEYKQMITAAAEILLDSDQAIPDAEGLYADFESAGFVGNVQFFGDPKYPRNFDNLNAEIQTAYLEMGLLTKRVPMHHAKWDYAVFKPGLVNVEHVNVPKFDKAEVTRFVNKLRQSGQLDSAGRYTLTITFTPNETSFPVATWHKEFDTMIDRLVTFGGAISTSEGYGDVLGYLKEQRDGATTTLLKQIKQSVLNTSYKRASDAVNVLIEYAEGKGVHLDRSQFEIVGHGMTKPIGGFCGADPCPPKTRDEWLSNMRVTFQIIPFNRAEATEFEAL